MIHDPALHYSTSDGRLLRLDTDRPVELDGREAALAKGLLLMALDGCDDAHMEDRPITDDDAVAEPDEDGPALHYTATDGHCVRLDADTAPPMPRRERYLLKALAHRAVSRVQRVPVTAPPSPPFIPTTTPLESAAAPSWTSVES